MEQRKSGGGKRVREKETNCIFSARMETVAKVQAVFLLSLWMLPLKAHHQIFLWSGQVNKTTWIWMRKQSWSQTHLLLTPLSGRRWGIHVWKGKTVKGGGIFLHKKSIIGRLSEQFVITITDDLSPHAMWRAFRFTKHNRSSMGLKKKVEKALFLKVGYYVGCT